MASLPRLELEGEQAERAQAPSQGFWPPCMPPSKLLTSSQRHKFDVCCGCAQAVGVLPADNPYPWRGNAFTNDSSVKLGFPDLAGGWMTGGIAGAAVCRCVLQ